jgi:hypothetical protein
MDWRSTHTIKAIVAARAMIATMSSKFPIVESSIVEVSVTSKEHPVEVCAYPKDGWEGGLVNSRPSRVSPSGFVVATPAHRARLERGL